MLCIGGRLNCTLLRLIGSSFSAFFFTLADVNLVLEYLSLSSDNLFSSCRSWKYNIKKMESISSFVKENHGKKPRQNLECVQAW